MVVFGRQLAGLLILWGLPSGHSPAQPHPAEMDIIRFERAEAVEEKLPQSSVHALHEDQQGFLWFGTREGLGRWDGYQMRTWRADPFNQNSLPGNLIFNLIEDGSGDLWVRTLAMEGSETGIARLVGPDYETVVRYGLPGAIPFVDKEKVLWLAASDHLYRFEQDRFVAMVARISPGVAANSAMVDRAGVIWVGSVAGVLERYDLRTGSSRKMTAAEPWMENLDSVPLSHLFEDKQGRIWLLGVGLRRLNPDRTRIETVPQLPAALKQVATTDLIQDPAGSLWLASLNGIFRFDPSATHFERFTLHLPGAPETQNWVASLHRDRAGILWAGTVWGLHRYDPFEGGFGLLEPSSNDPDGLRSGLVMAILEDDMGALWVGTLGGGLNRLDPDTQRFDQYLPRPGDPHSLQTDWVWSLVAAGAGRVWAGTADGYALVDPFSEKPVINFQIGEGGRGPDNTVWDVHKDAQGYLWIGAKGRILRRDRSGQQAIYPLPGRFQAEDFLSDAQGLWVATSSGLLRLDAATSSQQYYRHDVAVAGSLSSDSSISLYRDKQGRLWVGTQSGLNRFVSATGTFIHYNVKDGLPSSVINCILEDDDNHLWFSTNRGLVRLDEGAPIGQKFRTFNLTDGIGNLEFNRKACFRSRNGTMYFGGDRGVTFFDPKTFQDNPYDPPVVITALHRSNQKRTISLRSFRGGKVTIPPEDTTFSFDFAALSFSRPNRHRYAARLEAFDTDWIDLDGRRRATYTNVPPGRYTFRVKASSRTGVWNGKEVSIPVVVEPWLWQTWWFRWLLGLIVAVLFALAVWYVTHNRHQRQLQALRAQQAALEGERNRISRDMHDELGASLSEVAILSELAQLQDGQPDATQTQLKKIADKSRAMLDSIGEIIWAINPNHDRLDSVVAYLHEYAAEYLENTPLRVSLQFPRRVPSIPVSAEFRRNLFLVLKEALHNLVKHARANQARVILEVESNRLILNIEDDGCGFSLPTTSAKGNGLSNMQHRARESDGVLQIDSQPNRGTRVSLTLQLPKSA